VHCHATTKTCFRTDSFRKINALTKSDILNSFEIFWTFQIPLFQTFKNIYFQGFFTFLKLSLCIKHVFVVPWHSTLTLKPVTVPTTVEYVDGRLKNTPHALGKLLVKPPLTHMPRFRKSVNQIIRYKRTASKKHFLVFDTFKNIEIRDLHIFFKIWYILYKKGYFPNKNPKSIKPI